MWGCWREKISTFYRTILRLNPFSTVERAKRAIQRADGGRLDQKKRILVVEDETLIAMLLEDMLEELGYALAGSAHTLDGALALAKAADIDAAILDIELDNKKSWPVAEALMQRGIPFAFATGEGKGAAIDPRFSTAPILGKPYDAQDLKGALEGLLGAP